jgi:hypothetical protein
MKSDAASPGAEPGHLSIVWLYCKRVVVTRR